MQNEDANLRQQVMELRAENERLRQELARASADRDQYRRELFLAFPPPQYTEEEIVELINNRVPAAVVLNELREIVREHGK